MPVKKIRASDLVVTFLVGLSCMSDSFSAEVTTFGNPENRACYLRGAIDSNDISQLQKILTSCNTLMIDSPGGNIDAAMRIGRMIRQREIGVTVPERGECASACVFIYAAGVVRVNYGPIRIHRPFLADSNDLSLAKTQAKFAALERDAKRYLKEMNVRDSLYDAMMVIAPENSYALDVQEMEQYGMGRSDPVWSETLDNSTAKRLGMSKREFLSIKSRVGMKCGPYSPLMTKSAYECWRQEIPRMFAAD